MRGWEKCRGYKRKIGVGEARKREAKVTGEDRVGCYREADGKGLGRGR